jgi:hypothetical protein
VRGEGAKWKAAALEFSPTTTTNLLFLACVTAFGNFQGFIWHPPLQSAITSKEHLIVKQREHTSHIPKNPKIRENGYPNRCPI